LMRRTLTLITGPTADPVTLDEAKAWAKIDSIDDDPLLAALITAAIQSAEEYTRRAFISQTWKAAFDIGGSGLDLGEGVYDLPITALYGALPRVIELPKQPAQSITSVVTYDTSNASSTYATSNYSLIGNRLILTEGALWPAALRPFGACEITYVAGYGDTSTSIPQPIKTAILMHVQHMYDGRIVCDMPAPCESLLRKYRVMDGLGA
jgi:hypothetical protein